MKKITLIITLSFIALSVFGQQTPQRNANVYGQKNHASFKETHQPFGWKLNFQPQQSTFKTQTATLKFDGNTYFEKDNSGVYVASFNTAYAYNADGLDTSFMISVFDNNQLYVVKSK